MADAVEVREMMLFCHVLFKQYVTADSPIIPADLTMFPTDPVNELKRHLESLTKIPSGLVRFIEAMCEVSHSGMTIFSFYVSCIFIKIDLLPSGPSQLCLSPVHIASSPW